MYLLKNLLLAFSVFMFLFVAASCSSNDTTGATDGDVEADSENEAETPPVCTVGQSKCADDSDVAVLTCDAAQNWVYDYSCSDGKICEDGICVESTPEDGDVIPDGDVSDGDLVDGDSDEDTSDGDSIDGDDVDGDSDDETEDGDIVDGDSDDETIDGDASETDSDAEAFDCTPGTACCTADGEFADVGAACTDDDLDCTDDVCAAGGVCEHTLKSGRCLIGGTCYLHNQADSTETCHYCDTGVMTDAWTFYPRDTACDDDLFCNGSGATCNGNGVCEHPGDPCPATACNTCQEDTDSCFDPAGTVCSTVRATACDLLDTCDGAGQCLPNLAENGTDCDVDKIDCTEDYCQDGVCEASFADDTYCDSDNDFHTHAMCDTTYDCYNSGWALSFGSTSSDEFSDVVALADGGFAIVGAFKNTLDFTPGVMGGDITSNGDFDVFMAVFDADGTFRYARAFGGSGNDAGDSIAQLKDGGLAITGHFSDTIDIDPVGAGGEHTSEGSLDIFLAVFELDGTFRFSQAFGSDDADSGSNITVMQSGWIAIAGIFRETIDFNPGGTGGAVTSNGYADVFVAAFNAEGVFQFSHSFGGDSTDYVRDLEALNDGGLAVAGIFVGTVDFNPDAAGGQYTSVSNTTDVYILLYNADGSYRSSRAFGGASNDNLNGATVMRHGTLVITGAFQDEIDFDPKTADSGEHTATSQDTYLAAFDQNGNYQWSQNFPCDDVSQGAMLAPLADGGLYLVGKFVGNIDFDPDVENSGEHASVSTDFSVDSFFATFDYDGSYRRSESHLLDGLLFTSSAELKGRGLLMVGSFMGTLDLDLGAGTHEVAANGATDGFILRKNPPPVCSDFEADPCNGNGTCNVDSGFGFCACRLLNFGEQCENHP